MLTRSLFPIRLCLCGLKVLKGRYNISYNIKTYIYLNLLNYVLCDDYQLFTSVSVEAMLFTQRVASNHAIKIP